MKKKSFQIPKQILSQLNECSKGYFLCVVNDQGDFEIITDYPDQVTELGMLNFLSVQIDVNQEYIRRAGVESALDDDDEKPEDPTL